MKRLSFVFGVFACLLLLGAGCQAPTNESNDSQDNKEEPIVIGWLGPLTGDAAAIGQDTLKLAEQAAKEVNEAGGINGKELKIVAEDGKCNPKDASAAGNNLINVEQVPVIIGGLCSGETTAVAPIAEESKVVLFSGCSSAPNITDAGDFVFRSYPSDAFQGKFAAEYVKDELEKEKVAVLSVLGDYGTGIKNAFSSTYTNLGGEIVFSEDYSQEARDFKTQITKIKESGAELVYFPGYTEATIAFLKQAKELGLDVPMFGADAWSDETIHTSGVAEGIMYVVPESASSADWDEIVEAAGANDNPCTPGVYNNVKIIAEIMAEVGTNTEDIKNALYEVEDYEGVAGSISIDENGDLEGAEYTVQVVKDEKVEDVE